VNRPRARIASTAGRLAVAGLAGGAVVPALLRAARRSGVGAADIARALPGDDLIPDPELQIDRAGVIGAGAGELWPWIVQLGKGRAGWYMPRAIERFAVWPPRKRAAREIVEAFQSLQPGQRVPDWGPGEPSFEVVWLEPPRALVYVSRRDRGHNWAWPTADTPASEIVAFSWALVIDPIDDASSRLHIRLRGGFGRRGPLRPVLAALGGLFDYVTIVLLFGGLRERLAPPRARARWPPRPPTA
jgi:hypothetical protein